MKGRVRDLLPASWQVPAKYFYLRACGRLEAELELLPLLVSSGERALDVGANYGTYAFTLTRLGARVDLFEPNPTIAIVLGAWARGKKGVVVHGLALSDQSGTAQLLIPSKDGVEHDSSASITASSSENIRTGGRRVSVPMVPLDTLSITDAKLIKIDVEGHEDAVLRGAEQTIAASSPALIVEIEQRHINGMIGVMLEAVLARGYRGWFLCNGLLLPLSRFDPALHQGEEGLAGRARPYCNNFVFLAKTRIARGDYSRFLAQVAT